MIQNLSIQCRDIRIFLPKLPKKLKSVKWKCTYIYAGVNLNRSRDICFQSWPSRSEKSMKFSPKLSLWRRLPGSQGATRDFMLWVFLNWSIDCWIKSSKTKFGRITSGIFNHPSAHCSVRILKRVKAIRGTRFVRF